MEFIFRLSRDRASLMKATQSNDFSGLLAVNGDLLRSSNID